MYPELLKIGPITIYSYGLMLGVAFFVANILVTRELKRQGRDVSIATGVTMLALVAGVVGAKLFHILENWGDFLRAPAATAFSSGGLTWYGGFLLATLCILFYLRHKRMRMITFADIAAPALAIGYGFGRVGCQLAGDGDYGIPTDLPWAMTYPHGTVSTLSALNSELAGRYAQMYPGRAIPADIPVHPAPVYEILLAIAVFAFLYFRRTKPLPAGNQFAWFLVLHSACRFAVEIIRINPVLLLGLSQAQLLSIALFLWGAYLLYSTSVKSSNTAQQPQDARS
jgi:phosphatidylglycerol---prolipoprotein diacylglyceryl transferase